MTGLAIAALALGCYIAAVALLVGHAGRRSDQRLADLDTPIDLVPVDDLMAVADAVQDERPPLFVDEYLTARDFQLWQIENGWITS